VHLDLAILRVGRKDLKPLSLGDSDTLRQGERIVAMGNPVGLAFSVVEGVVSEPKRDIDGMPMIQLAVPIERGNSGGPLLDRQGRVLGLLTMKSARTENLGFAMPVNELKKLLEKPNPVPMNRWLTIGVLNPRVWKPLMGAQWSQHAGVVNVQQAGEGFGGRSLCLWRSRRRSSRWK
jgi:serine protease Do